MCGTLRQSVIARIFRTRRARGHGRGTGVGRFREQAARYRINCISNAIGILLWELTPALLRPDPMFGARENPKQAVAMVLQANRELAEESLRGAEVLREPRH